MGKKSLWASIASILLLGACAELPTGSVGDHALKEANYGYGEIFTLQAFAPLPLDKRYDELTADQKGMLRSWYKNLGPDDEPPYPEQGLQDLYEKLIGAHHGYQVYGQIFVVAHIDALGVAHSAAILPAGNYVMRDEVNQYFASVLMKQKYKPGKCNGTPCAMDFGVSINYYEDSHQ